MSNVKRPEHILAAFVGEGAPPRAATDRAALALIDFSLCAVAAARSPSGRRILRAAVGRNGTGKPGAITQEFILAAAGHVLDCDDNHDTIGGHPSSVVFPALLHGIRSADATVSDLYVPYVVGLEAMAAVARSIGRAPYQKGWHTTCIYGALGAAAALARTQASGREVTMAALGLATSFASGIKASFGTDAKSLQVGHAALAGVLSHELAAAGCSASAEALSGPQGLAAVLDVPRPRWEELAGLGSRWETVDPGIVFKRFPCCASTHAPIEAVLALRQPAPAAGTAGPDPGVPGMAVTIHAGRLQHVDRPAPRTALDAKFSLQFTVAAAWVDGRCTVEQFAEDRLTDPKIGEVMRRITVHGATDLPWSAARVRCVTDDGIKEMSIDAATGHSAETPISIGDLAAKADSLSISADEFTRIRDAILAGNMPVKRLAQTLNAAVSGNADALAGINTESGTS